MVFKKGELRDLYDRIFAKSWPMWVGGITLAVLNIMLFVVKYPWGSSSGYTNIGQNLFQVLGIKSLGTSVPISLHAVALLNIFVVMGAFVSSLLSKEFGIRVKFKKRDEIIDRKQFIRLSTEFFRYLFRIGSQWNRIQTRGTDVFVFGI